MKLDAVDRRTVHLVYPHGPRISCPDAIGRNLSRILGRSFEVRTYDWDARDRITPSPGDVLLGHPHPNPSTVFRTSVGQPGWSRTIALSPFVNSDLPQCAFLNAVLPHVDLYLAITGPYWFATLLDSVVAHWTPKMIRIDLAVDRGDFPVVRPHSNSRGKRRIVYIGHTGKYKNPGYLEAIAALLPDVGWAWVGSGRRRLQGFATLGTMDFSTPQGRGAVGEFDFLLTVGEADANPTTVLEAMAWGLIPICTPQSGYVGVPSIPNVPLRNPRAAAAIIRALVDAPATRLEAMREANWGLLDAHYNWERFGDQVLSAIASDDSPSLLPHGRSVDIRLRFAELRSPYAAGPAGELRRRLTKAASAADHIVHRIVATIGAARRVSRRTKARS